MKIYFFVHISIKEKFNFLYSCISSWCVLKAKDVWRAGGGNMKTLNDWLHPSKKVPPGPFDMFLFHSQWRYQEVQKVMQTSAVTITILRDPVDTFESGYSYFGRAPKVLRYLKHLLIVDINCQNSHRI